MKGTTRGPRSCSRGSPRRTRGLLLTDAPRGATPARLRYTLLHPAGRLMRSLRRTPVQRVLGDT